MSDESLFPEAPFSSVPFEINASKTVFLVRTALRGEHAHLQIFHLRARLHGNVFPWTLLFEVYFPECGPLAYGFRRSISDGAL